MRNDDKEDLKSKIAFLFYASCSMRINNSIRQARWPGDNDEAKCHDLLVKDWERTAAKIRDELEIYEETFDSESYLQIVSR